MSKIVNKKLNIVIYFLFVHFYRNTINTQKFSFHSSYSNSSQLNQLFSNYFLTVSTNQIKMNSPIVKLIFTILILSILASTSFAASNDGPVDTVENSFAGLTS